jgi:hypothetical protein
MPHLWDREPAMLIALVQSALALAVGFGVTITPEQFGLVMAFVAALLGFVTRSQVTPAK